MKADFVLTQFKTEAQTRYAIDNSLCVEFHKKGLVHRRWNLLEGKMFTNTLHTIIGGRSTDKTIAMNFLPWYEDIVDNTISRVHFMLRWLPVDDAVSIGDLNSTNGTFINGKRLKRNKDAVLKDGDIITVGETELLFERKTIQGVN